jgi:hypothetical protein
MTLVGGSAKLAKRRAEMQLTPRQLFIGLAAAGLVTDDEAIASAALGTLPAAVEAVVAGLSPAEQTAARITWARMGVVERTDPLVALLAAQAGKTAEDVDAFFETFAAI